MSYSKDKITVKTEDGYVYQAKYAIVSVSIGVLQNNLIEFLPNLPVSKLLLLSYSVVNLISVVFFLCFD